MAITHLDTQYMTDAVKTFSKGAKEFSEEKQRLEKTTNDLLNNWVGKGRNSFESKYKLLYGRLDDLEKELYDFYDALVDAESEYYDADEQIGKDLTM